MTRIQETSASVPTRPVVDATAVGDNLLPRRVRPTVSVDELQRAWAAVRDGWFRDAQTPKRPPAGEVWRPVEPTVVVAGAVPRTGTSMLALAIAESSTGPARVIECCDPSQSGLAAASSAELGNSGDGRWRRARRDQVLIERLATRTAGLPVPPAGQVSMNVVDGGAIGGTSGSLAGDGTWLTVLLTQVPVVVVTVATVPGLRALSSAVEALGRTDVWCAVLGPRRKKWPAAVALEMSPTLAAIEQAGRLVVVPHDRDLAINGLTGDRLPAGVMAAAKVVADGLAPTDSTAVEAVAS